MLDFYHLVVVIISFGAAFFSGLLGIGGGIIIFPSFLYLIPFLGFNSFSVNEITGIAAAQSLAGISFSFLNHRKHGNINVKLVKSVLPIGLIGGIIGSISARFFEEKTLLIIYLVLLAMAMTLTSIPKAECNNNNDECSFEKPIITNVLIFLGTAISGALGFAGAVTFIPILNHFCKVPFKVAISSTTLIVMITTFFVFLGKASVGLVPFDLIISIIIGALLGANIGARLNKKLPASVLRIILMLVILILGTRILLTVLEY